MPNNLRLLLNAHKRNLIDVYKHSIEAVKPDRLLLNSVTLQDDTLVIDRKSNSTTTGGSSDPIKINLQNKNVHVLGGGKCVLSMAKGLAEIFTLGDKSTTNRSVGLFSHGCLSLPIGQRDDFNADTTTRTLLDHLEVKCLFGSENNLPDRNSVESSEFLLNQIGIACQQDKLEDRQTLFIILISGGGSACLSSPRFISLERKLELIKQLVEKGATIVELNKVRRYFSNIKGGNLARHILKHNPRAQVLTLLLSDVVGDPIEFIASGPTYLDECQSKSFKQQHYQSMCNILHKYNMEIPTESFCSVVEAQNADHDCMDTSFSQDSIVNVVIGNNRIALDAARSKAESLGYSVKYLGDSMRGPTEQVVDEILRFSSECGTHSSQTKQPILICCGGETTVEKQPNESWGKGGRAQEMALDYMISKLTSVPSAGDDADKSPLSQTTPEDDMIDLFLAGGTDGQDGPTDVAACLASVFELKLLSSSSPSFCDDSKQQLKTLDLNELKLAKKKHDSYSFWQSTKPDWLVKTGLTGTNVMDLYFHLVASSSSS